MKTKLSVLLLCIAVISSCTSKRTGGSAPVADYKMMIIAKLSVKPEKVKDFVAVAKEMIEKSNQESGCSSYQLYQDPYDNSKFVFVEEYKNQAAIDTHFSMEYFKAFGPKIGDFVKGPAEIKIVSVAKEVFK